MVYYAIAKGKRTGVFTSWEEVKKYVFNFHGAKFRKFNTIAEAENFVNEHTFTQSKLTSFIAVSDPEENDKTLIAFTDGSCTHNGSVHARAAYAVVWPYHSEMNFVQEILPPEHRTNNRAEYRALIHAFKQADILDDTKQKTLITYTDSKLLIQSLTEWMPSWKRNNWRKSDQSEVLNKDLLMELDELSTKRSFVLRHVKAHTNEQSWEAKHNDMVDKLARSVLLK